MPITMVTTTPSKAQRVEAALDLGFTFSEAVQRALGCGITALAEKYGVPQPTLSMCLLAYEGRVYPDLRERIAADLNASRDQVDEWIARSAAGVAAAS